MRRDVVRVRPKSGPGSRRSGTARCAEPFALALQSAHQVTAQRLRWALDSLFVLGGLAPVIGPVIQALDNATAASNLVDSAKAVWRSTTSRLERALTTDVNRRFGQREGALDAAASDARLLAALTTVVPLVIVVDDAEGLDDVTLALVDTLVRSAAARVMCVLAINTDHHATHPVDLETRPGDNEDLHSFAAPLHDQGRLEVLDLAPFSDLDLVAVARHLLTEWTLYDAEVQPERFDASVAASLVLQANGAPGRLATLVELRSVRRALTGQGSLPQDPGHRARRDALDEAWQKLPQTNRAALAALAVHGPATMSGFQSTPVRTAAVETGWVTQTPIRAGEQTVVAFRSDILHEVASSYLSAELTAEEIQDIRSVLAERLSIIAGSDTWTSLPIHVAQSLLEAVASEVREAPPALVAALMRLRRASGLEAATEARIEAILERGDITTELRLVTAEALADAGYQHRAIDLWVAELSRLESRYGVGDPRTIATLHNLASAWAAYAASLPIMTARAAYTEAIRLYRDLIVGYGSPNHSAHRTRRLPDTRLELAYLFESLGQFSEAAKTAGPAIDEYIRVGSPEVRNALVTRVNVAHWHEVAGDAKHALGELEEVLPLVERVFGPHGPETLSARGNLARARGYGGDAEGAAADFEKLLPDMELVLGTDAPSTLITRHNLAYWRGEAGATEEAVSEMEDLLPIQERLFGREHPHTLTTRLNLTRWARDAESAVTALAELLPLFERVFGPEHPHTLTTRDSLAYWQSRL